MSTHRDLIVYQKSIQFVTEIYELTAKFPKSEQFGIISQMRRCAISIPSNIAEGSARNHIKEFIQFLYISLGSASELETQIIISKNLTFIGENDSENLLNNINEISRMINGLIIRKKSQLRGE